MQIAKVMKRIFDGLLLLLSTYFLFYKKLFDCAQTFSDLCNEMSNKNF